MDVLAHAVLLLFAALVFGTLAEYLRQSAIVGYLIGGMLVGPHVLGWVPLGGTMDMLANLGVALLLFSIGLEFSIKRLTIMGSVLLLGGTLQILITAIVCAGVASYLGMGFRSALAVGLIATFSSTACVVRVLGDRTRLESISGRTAMGISLLQDVAVVPLTLVLSALGEPGSATQATMAFVVKIGKAGLYFGAMFVLLNYITPRFFHAQSWARNRDFPILMAVVLAIASAASAHMLGLNPALGAFAAGMLLAESPFANQVRSDVGSLRVLLVTLFFVSIGMFGNPQWMVQHLPAVAGLTLGILLLKTAITWAVLRMLRIRNRIAMEVGLITSQVGEFSFVLAGMALSYNLLTHEHFQMIVSVTVLTLVLTPYMIRNADTLSEWVDGLLDRASTGLHRRSPRVPASELAASAEVVIIGFGPAGQQASRRLIRQQSGPIMVIDLNPRNVAVARAMGLECHIADAGQHEAWEAYSLSRVHVVIVTIPDPDQARQIVQHCRHNIPGAQIFCRVRYHMFRDRLTMAGADFFVDEEVSVGNQLADAVLNELVSPLQTDGADESLIRNSHTHPPIDPHNDTHSA